MNRGAKMSILRVWLDDRRKQYSQIDNTMRIRKNPFVDEFISVEHTDGGYMVNGVTYRSQREVINKALVPFFDGHYKTM